MKMSQEGPGPLTVLDCLWASYFLKIPVFYYALNYKYLFRSRVFVHPTLL